MSAAARLSPSTIVAPLAAPATGSVASASALSKVNAGRGGVSVSSATATRPPVTVWPRVITCPASPPDGEAGSDVTTPPPPAPGTSLTLSRVAPAGGRSGGAAERRRDVTAANTCAVAPARACGANSWRARRPRGRSCLRNGGDTAARGTRLALSCAASVVALPRTFANTGAASGAHARAAAAAATSRRPRAQPSSRAEGADLLVHREHVADLLPGRAHVTLLVRAHHARTQARRSAVARIEVHGTHPAAILRCGADAIDLRVPAAVDGRRDERIATAVVSHIGRRVEQRQHLRHEIAGGRERLAHRRRSRAARLRGRR